MKNVLTRNIGLKIISLVLAAVIWVCINGLIDPVTTVTIKDVPVQILNEEEMKSKNKIYDVVSGQTIDLKVKAKQSIADDLTAADFKATADFLLKSYMDTVFIDVVCVSHTENEVDIVDGMSEIMKLTLEDSDTQSFAVSVIADGTVADGYYISDSITNPKLISVFGPKTQIGNIAKLSVLVDVEGTSESFTVTGTPVIYDAEGNVMDTSKLELSAEQVEVSVKMLPTKVIDLRVVTEGKAYYDYALTGLDYAPNTITIAGEAEDLKNITYLDLKCSISGAKKDVETELSIEEALNDLYGNKYIVVDETKAVTVKATIVKQESKELSLLANSIEIKNIPDGYQADYSALTAVLKLTGLKDDLDKTSVATLKPYVDCSVCTSAGTYNLEVQTSVIPGIEVRSSTIEVVLTQGDNVIGSNN